ncbi:MAG: HPr family phosphocarrier protein [Pseudomonadota bacterium]
MSKANDTPAGHTDAGLPQTGPVEARAVLRNRRGLHARASAKFCAVASAWDARVRVTKDGYEVGGCSIMGLLTLGAGVGEAITIAATGPQASEAVDALVRLLEDRFGEKE